MLKNLKIEEIKIGESEGGMACGPCYGNIVGEMQIVNVENKERFFVSMVDVQGGMPEFMKANVSFYDKLIEDDIEDPFWDERDQYITGAYPDFTECFEAMEKLKENDPDMYAIWKCLIYLVRSDWDDTNAFKAEIEGKLMSEIEIPVGEDEQDYLDEMDE